MMFQGQVVNCIRLAGTSRSRTEGNEPVLPPLNRPSAHDTCPGLRHLGLWGSNPLTSPRRCSGWLGPLLPNLSHKRPYRVSGVGSTGYKGYYGSTFEARHATAAASFFAAASAAPPAPH